MKKSMQSRMKLLTGAMLSLSLMTNTVTNATERETLEQLRNTTVNLVRMLVQEGVLSKQKAELLIKQAQRKAKETPAKYATPEEVAEAEKVGKAIDKEMVRIQYVPEHIKEEMREDIETVVMQNLNYKADERLKLPGWIDRLHWEGDVRLRYEHDRFGDNNPTALNYRNANLLDDSIEGVNNFTEDRDRFRVRARLALTADISEKIKGGMRITTGSLRDPLSHNQTQEAGTGKYTIGLDRAYLKADVKPWLSLVGGRFENPFFHTDLVWDPDLAFDGIAATFKPEINDRLSGFVTAGVFPIEEIEESDIVKAESKWLYGGQAGLNWQATDKARVKLGVAYYDFDNMESELNPANDTLSFNGSAPSYRRKGNTAFDINRLNNGNIPPVFGPNGLASEFKELNVTGEVELAYFDPVHVTLTGDYVKNIGFDKDDVFVRTGEVVEENTDAYQARLTVGMPVIEKAHDWRAYFAYKYLEADAVVDAFTDSNFFLGGTNAKGWVIEANYGIDKNTWISTRWLSAEEIDPRGNLNPLNIDVFLLDINTRF